MSVPPASAIAGPSSAGSEVAGVGPTGAELVAGLAHTHHRADANTTEIHRANATAGALAELLIERGILAREDLDERRRAIGEVLRAAYVERGMGVSLQEVETSKYQIEEAPKIDCASRLPLCKGACCRLTFALTTEDVAEGVVRWDLRRPYVVAHGATGRCVHQEEGTCRCSIYQQRPATCRTYDCRRDRRIWLDFERRIPNPALEDPEWPASVPQPEAPALQEIDRSSSWTTHGQPIAPRARDAINGIFDRIVRARLSVLGRSTSSFQIWGYSGLVAAILLGVLLVAIQGLSFGVLGVLIVSSCATFLALAMGTKIVTGEEKLIYYHHEVGILLVAGVVLRVLDQPVLPYLELTLLATGMFLAWGRVGCLMVGCCHGRPHDWGVRYGPDHVEDGFPAHLTDVRLFPIQLVESITVLSVVAWGTVLVATGRPSGEALGLYVMVYGAARFVLEFARGDPDRPYVGGFSEAQWTSLLLMALALGAGLRGTLPLHAWHPASVVLVAACVLAVTSRRRRAAIPTYEILHPRHLDEIARVLRAFRAFARTDVYRAAGSGGTAEVLVGTTSQGLRLSAGSTEDSSGALSHYGISSRDDGLTPPVARVLGRLILRLEHPDDSGQLVSRTPGLFHLVVRPRSGQRTRRS